MKNRKICVVTGSRAEYGLLHWLLKDLQAEPKIDLQLVVTGMHLSAKFGSTYKLIEKDGFSIDHKVDIEIDGDNPKDIAQSLGRGTIGFAEVFSLLKPDILIVLGDRYEIFAAVQAAMVTGILIAHIHGGELTEGAIDDTIRHAITKMSHYHFVAAEPYRNRVIQMGENPDYVLNYGTPGLDNLSRLNLLSKEELEKVIGLKLGHLSLLVTFHPITRSRENTPKTLTALLHALGSFTDSKIIFTRPNADMDNKIINRLIDEFAGQHASRVRVFTSMGQLRYLSAMKHTDIVVGNSSSGVGEAPAMKKPSVNIGDRQQGRLKAASVIDCAENKEAIITAIKKGLSKNFQDSFENMITPYKEENASKRIKEYLQKADLRGVEKKKFYDFSKFGMV